jgi:hypothetical protein
MSAEEKQAKKDARKAERKDKKKVHFDAQAETVAPVAQSQP